MERGLDRGESQGLASRWWSSARVGP